MRITLLRMKYSTDLFFLARAVVGKRTLPRYADALLDVYGEQVQPPRTRMPQTLALS